MVFVSHPINISSLSFWCMITEEVRIRLSLFGVQKKKKQKQMAFLSLLSTFLSINVDRLLSHFTWLIPTTTENPLWKGTEFYSKRKPWYKKNRNSLKDGTTQVLISKAGHVNPNELHAQILKIDIIHLVSWVRLYPYSRDLDKRNMGAVQEIEVLIQPIG